MSSSCTRSLDTARTISRNEACRWPGVQNEHAVKEKKSKSMPIQNDTRAVAPALERYAQGALAELWRRPGLTPRDRGIVTLAALIPRNQTIEMPHYLEVALDSGVKPREISEIMTHLAFYSGWANARSAVEVARPIFARRGIGADQPPSPSPSLLPLDKDAEQKRADSVEQQFGNFAPGIVQYTTDILFRVCGSVQTVLLVIGLWLP